MILGTDRHMDDFKPRPRDLIDDIEALRGVVDQTRRGLTTESTYAAL